MFVRSETDKRRIKIIDVSGFFYRYAYGGATALSTTIMVDGIPTRVDTTLPSYVIKDIYRLSRGGLDPTVVCFDGRGSTKSRKAYFLQASGVNAVNEAQSYKGSRESQSSRFYEGVNLTMNLLLNGGVCCLKLDGFEADDLVMCAINKAKESYPDLPIDVYTGDNDLVPLVDEQVSVFLYSRKLTWAEEKSLEKLHYIQLRPENMQDYMEGLTNYKTTKVPYNTVLLHKCLRGDKSDEVKGYPKFTPKMYNNLIDSLTVDEHDLGNLFRYDSPTKTYCYRGTEEPIPVELLDSTPKEQKMIKFGDPPKLTEMCNVLSNYLDNDVIEHIRFVYKGINLNGAFVGLPEGFNRRPAVLTADIKGFTAYELQKAVSGVQINLPVL